MADISAADVMKLRKMSGQGMMDCKQALAETGGDLEEAMTLLRKKGLATLAKRAGRDATEGKVVCQISSDGKVAAMGSLCCETDFVSKNDDFIATAELLKKYMDKCPADSGTEELAKTNVDGVTFGDVITECVSKTGEKTEIGDYTKFSLKADGIIGSYIHFNGKMGAMVEIETSDAEVAGKSEMGQLAIDIAMHITAINPAGLDSDSIDPDVLAKEREIAADQVKNKPAEIIDKIVDGKMRKFLSDNCLVDQGFVKDEKVPVAQVVSDTAKKCGGTAKIKRFVRIAIG
ncbi:MAG: translation elongation factor Ts [Anaerohalosphaeraceae bacterium]|nr:translation elongation factor Ts [Anaerohalosphaeraceae bacterium]